MTTVYVVVPEGIDDPTRSSGGNTYDRRICRELTAIGWSVHERAVPGRWPSPDAAARRALADALAAVPDRSLVLVDGLIASPAPEVLVPEAGRVRLVVLVHMPLWDEAPSERTVLVAAAAVVTTSVWTRNELLERYGLRPGQVHVAEPGVEPADLVPGSSSGGRLLCVAAVTQLKGHDVLLESLASVKDLVWRCVCVGALDRDPDLSEHLARQAEETGIGDRVSFVGSRTGRDLNAAYDAADVLVHASRAETYGMVVSEALGRGLPVIATSVGGVPEALGHGVDRCLPGLLVPPSDPQAFAEALRRWLEDADLRSRLRRAAAERRLTLPDWSATTGRIARVLDQAAA
ncbi:MAG: glycosyltransferase family 4 protein [Aeromicrobium sp.]|nr:glycosyltransferase family 4 protein [Aeromicrobium sp.]